MSDNGTMQGMEPTASDRDREETVLASPSVQARVDGETWTGTAEVLLERDPGGAIALECLFVRGVEAGPAAAMAREPGRLTDLLVDGKPVAGRGTRATFFDDNDGAKLLVTWRPEKSAVLGAFADLGSGGSGA